MNALLLLQTQPKLGARMDVERVTPFDFSIGFGAMFWGFDPSTKAFEHVRATCPMLRL